MYGRLRWLSCLFAFFGIYYLSAYFLLPLSFSTVFFQSFISISIFSPLLLFTLYNLPFSKAQDSSDAEADVSLATASISVDSIASRNGQWYACKCYPGDRCFPSSTVWTRFNTTVGGNLQVALPPGAPCYNNLGGLNTYDSAKCAEVQANWSNEQWK